jgi:hypothetical protein
MHFNTILRFSNAEHYCGTESVLISLKMARSGIVFMSYIDDILNYTDLIKVVELGFIIRKTITSI